MFNQIKRIIAKNRLLYYISCIAFCISGFLASALFLVMRIFPIQKNKIVCCSMKGKRYGDNPKYIADEIIRRGLDYEIVWLMRSKYDVDLPREIRIVNYNLFSCAYELATAQIWIDSNTKPLGTLKRKGQYYIQTWHGSYGLKKMYGDTPGKTSFFDRAIIQCNSAIEDLLLSNSKMTSEIYRKAFGYNGVVLECGSPKNDIFFDNRDTYTQKVKNCFHLTEQKIVLYAPTFRDDFRLDDMRLDFKRLLRCLRQKFGGEWVVLIRLHPNNIADAEQFITYTDKIINATNYNVMQELLAACDLLISDYSSCMFDFVTKKAPCFMYATDVTRYTGERDFYFDPHELPIPLAENNDELEKNILAFDETVYQKQLENLFARVGLCDNGNASRKTVDWIISHIQGD